MILSLLIPTLASRGHLYNRLTRFLNSQLNNGLEQKIKIVTLLNTGSKTIGFYRNELIKQCTTPYACFIDDDDMVDSLYCRDIINTIEQESPDAIGFKGMMTNIRTQRSEMFIHRCGEKYEKRASTYFRPPNHLNPMKTEFFRQVPFPELRHGEDYGQCLELQKANLIQSCSFIDKIMYHYLFNPVKKNV